MATRTHQRRNGRTSRNGARAVVPVPVPSAPRSEAQLRGDSLVGEIDDRIDERFDNETTRSSLAILLSGFAVLMAAVAGITILLIAGDDQSTESRVVVPGAAAASAGTVAAAAPMDHSSASAAAGAKVDFEPYKRPAGAPGG